jgi:hypothetical protein
MGRYGDRLSVVLDSLRAAQRAAGVARGKAQDGGQKAIVNRADDVLSYSETVLRAVDPSLLSASRLSQAQTLADEAKTALAAFDPETASDLENADQVADRLIDLVSAVPHRPIEQAAQQGKELAKSFQRSARQRENALRTETGQLKKEIKSLDEAVGSAKEELSSAVESSTNALDARIGELGERLDAAAETQTQLAEEQTTAFDDAQKTREEAYEAWRAERLAELEQQRTDAESDFQQAIADGRQAADRLVDELKRKDAAAEELVGSISIRGTADRYEKEAQSQAAIADAWRLVTVVVGLLAGVAAGSAAFLGDQNAAHIAGKLALGLLFAGVAGYTARQSSEHRQREERAKKLHLDLAAFSPFIEPLPEDVKHEERVFLGRRIFGQTGQSPEVSENGTSVTGLIPRRAAADEDAA